MKMTDADERALDVLDRLVQDLGSITEDDAIGLQNYLRARLAADQQKGGGKTVRSDGATHCACCGGWNLPDCPPCCDTPQPSIPAPAQQSPVVDEIRAAGWAVAVHNDYRLDGVPHTFWLFTKGDRAIKGEGRTDAEALAQVMAALAHPPHADQETQG